MISPRSPAIVIPQRQKGPPMRITDCLSQLTDDELRCVVRGIFERNGLESNEGGVPNKLINRFKIEQDSNSDNTPQAIEALALREAAHRFLQAKSLENKKKPNKPKSPVAREIESMQLPAGWRFKRYGRHHNVEVLTRPGGGYVTIDFDRRRFVLGQRRPSRESQFYEGQYWKRHLLAAAIEALEAEQQAYSVMSPRM